MSEARVDHLEAGLDAAVDRWDGLGWARPDVAFVSGSGLAIEMPGRVVGRVDLAELLPFEARGIEGHPLRVELLEVGQGRHLVYFRGRLHLYQGFTPPEVVFPTRLAARLGVRVLLLSNAAGGVSPELHPGQLVLLRDHLNLTGRNPLEGEPPSAWGLRFPDLSEPYSRRLSQLVAASAAAEGIEIPSGIYAAVLGPSYETPAEVRMLASLGADLVGMSTAHETIAARHMGVEVACLSLVTNHAAGVGESVLTHDEVIAEGRAAAAALRSILARVLVHPDLLA